MGSFACASDREMKREADQQVTVLRNNTRSATVKERETVCEIRGVRKQC